MGVDINEAHGVQRKKFRSEKIERCDVMTMVLTRIQ